MIMIYCSETKESTCVCVEFIRKLVPKKMEFLKNKLE